VITPEQNIYSSGQLVIKNKYGGPDTIFKDWKAHGYTDMRKALEESSDEYFYQVGGGYKDQKGLGIEKINKYSRNTFKNNLIKTEKKDRTCNVF
jgi:penicillin-binding protein 2